MNNRCIKVYLHFSIQFSLIVLLAFVQYGFLKETDLSVTHGFNLFLQLGLVLSQLLDFLLLVIYLLQQVLLVHLQRYQQLLRCLVHIAQATVEPQKMLKQLLDHYLLILKLVIQKTRQQVRVRGSATYWKFIIWLLHFRQSTHELLMLSVQLLLQFIYNQLLPIAFRASAETDV